MNNSEILKLIKVKELEIKKLQLEIDKLKKHVKLKTKFSK